MKNIPWTIEERQTCRAIVDSSRHDIAHVDRNPGGSITSRDYTAAELTDRIRLMAAAPKLVLALQEISSNAAESVEWIRRVCERALKEALPQYKIGDRVRSIECGWLGQVIDHTWINGDEMLKCQHPHHDGSLATDDTRWFSPADVRIVDNDPFVGMRSIRVVFADPRNNIETTINGTRAEICRYYDRPVNIGSSDTDERFERPIAIEFINERETEPIRVDYEEKP